MSSPTLSSASTASAHWTSELGAWLAQHPLACWLAGMLLAAALARLALGGLRAVRSRRGQPQQDGDPCVTPGAARWPMLAAMVASAVALVLASMVISRLAESGLAGGRWGQLDDALAGGLRAGAGQAVLQVFAALTHLGDAWALTALTLAVGALLWARGHRLLATGWMVALAGNGAITRVLKHVFERVRPEHVHGVAQADGFSFPSGHSSASMVAYAMLAYLGTRLLPARWHVPAALLAGALIFTTGWSRVVLQVHYASDVLAGWLVGGTWMVCTVLIMDSVSRWRGAGREGNPPRR